MWPLSNILLDGAEMLGAYLLSNPHWEPQSRYSAYVT